MHEKNMNRQDTIAAVSFLLVAAFKVNVLIVIIISALIFTGMLVLSLKKVHPIIIILLSGVIGIVAGYLPI